MLAIPNIDHNCATIVHHSLKTEHEKKNAMTLKDKDIYAAETIMTLWAEGSIGTAHARRACYILGLTVRPDGKQALAGKVAAVYRRTGEKLCLNIC